MEVSAATEQKSLLATLAPGKRTRLRRLLFEFGPGNGTLLLLPIDQGIEHGPRDFFANPASKDPEYQFRLAAEAGYSAIACQIGLAEKYYPDYAGQVPLLLKVNGKTDLPPSDEALSTTNASVEDAVRLGADAVGYTLYVGSPAPGPGPAPAPGRAPGLRPLRDAARRSGPTRAAPRSTPRAARTPSTRSTTPPGWRWRWAPTSSSSTCRRPGRRTRTPPPPTTRSRSPRRRRSRQVVASAGRSLVVLSGGSKIDDDKLLEQTRYIMEAGGSGVIYGRNVWQRESVGGARDHRADQGDHALQRPADPVARFELTVSLPASG